MRGGMIGSYKSDTRKEPGRSGRMTGNLGFWGMGSCNAHMALSGKGNLLCHFLQYVGHLIFELRHCMASGIALDFAC